MQLKTFQPENQALCVVIFLFNGVWVNLMRLPYIFQEEAKDINSLAGLHCLDTYWYGL